uniref:Transmembrane protein n=1 Tax=Macrostomum lignano TaxID=282301 RepID=A0A1I8FPK7_9PLAT
DAQNRPAPQIRQPSARQSSRVAKAVSFNLHRPPQQQQSDEALESGLQHHKQPKKSETQKSTERQRKKRAAGKDTSQQGITDRNEMTTNCLLHHAAGLAASRIRSAVFVSSFIVLHLSLFSRIILRTKERSVSPELGPGAVRQSGDRPQQGSKVLLSRRLVCPLLHSACSRRSLLPDARLSSAEQPAQTGSDSGLSRLSVWLCLSAAVAGFPPPRLDARPVARRSISRRSLVVILASFGSREVSSCRQKTSMLT